MVSAYLLNRHNRCFTVSALTNFEFLVPLRQVWLARVARSMSSMELDRALPER